MVMPLYDDNSDRRLFPIVNYILIALNIFFFVVLQGLGENDRFTYAFSLVPEEIVTGRDLVTEPETITDPRTGMQRLQRPGLEPTPFSVYITLFTSMFMHGSIMHIVGNMLFLWIFGDNVEDELGHFRYLLYYLTCGLLADAAHIMWTYGFGGDPRIPCLGASGAISGVLGGYLLLHPHRRVTVLVFRMITEVPAYMCIGLWFLFQLIESLGSFGRSGGGVAYGAHIGGFIAGAVLVKVFHVGIPQREEIPVVVRMSPRHRRRGPFDPER